MSLIPRVIVLKTCKKMATVQDEAKQDGTGVEVLNMSTEIIQHTWLLDSEIKIMKKEDGANIDLDSQRKDKCAVIKTSTRQTYFLPMIGLVDAEKLKPGDLVGYDSWVKATEVDERPREQYSDIGGLDKQIQELVEATVLSMNHKEKFENLRIQPPKGKTLLAWACRAQTKATFLKLAGPQLVQMFTGDGAKLVWDAFTLAKEKAPSIIFTDELDAIGTKHLDSEKSGDQEVQRTMLELLNQLDGFQPNTQVKVIAVTNRVDILDPALSSAWARIMQIHSQKMNVSPDLARCIDDFNGARGKAVCVEAGMIPLRRGATELTHEDYMEGILEVQVKKKANLQYYA
uniref:AAA+ ATPase domain-containing protein n=1 Tax=Nomascus leucogenys TaxID=61853 RepID=A0A2I3GMD4_NOMLE